MKIAMRLTLDGLVRALRDRADQMADEIESRYVPRRQKDEAGFAARSIGGRGTADDDISGG